MAIPFHAPTAPQHQRFLISFVFAGSMNPGITECVKRAYLDLSRTVHGVGRDSNANSMKTAANNLVETCVRNALGAGGACQQDAFDQWHEASCGELCDHFRKHGYETFRIGQAQKWLNMTVKYSLSLAELEMIEVPRLSLAIAMAHVPIDNLIIRAFDRCKKVPLVLDLLARGVESPVTMSIARSNCGSVKRSRAMPRLMWSSTFGTRRTLGGERWRPPNIHR